MWESLWCCCYLSKPHFATKFPPAWILLCSLISLHGSLRKPEKATSSTSFFADSEGTAQNPPHSSTVLLPLAVISLSHWSMIHVCARLSLLAHCTAAHRWHCAAADAAAPSPVIMTGLTQSPLTNVCLRQSTREKDGRWEGWIDRQEEKGARMKGQAEHMLLA